MALAWGDPRAKACRRGLKCNAGRGRDLLDLRDRHRVTAVCSAFGGEGTERQADADDDSRKSHADSGLDIAADGGKHDGLLGLFSAMSALLRGLVLRHGKVLQGYIASDIAGEWRLRTGESTHRDGRWSAAGCERDHHAGQVCDGGWQLSPARQGLDLARLGRYRVEHPDSIGESSGR